MLSYQHLYHAGNPADVHKHALLAFALDYMAAKDKPLTYIETHAGRGLYDLGAPEALKTGEAAAGVGRLLARFPAGHPYVRAVAAARAGAGPRAYPGSPLIAAALLRPDDTMHLCELHPQEYAALRAAMPRGRARLWQAEGMAQAIALTPPEPRRGLMLVDPSWEVKADYETMPDRIAALRRRWGVGVVMLWYPLLAGDPQAPMLARLRAAHPGAFVHEQRFPPVRPGHRMAGSGLFVLNPPWGIEAAAAAAAAVFAG